MWHFLRFSVAIACLSVLGAGAATAAGFDCSKAATSAEKMICGDTELSRLDEVLAVSYRRALARAVDADAFQAVQKAWLHVVRDGCGDNACMATAYRKRILQLHALDGFNLANGLKEGDLYAFIRAELNLGDSELVQVVPLRSPRQASADTVAFFASNPEYGVVRRGIVDVTGTAPRMLRTEDYPCHCSSIESASPAALVVTELNFVAARYVPRSGSCVTSERIELLRVDRSGGFQQVWTGESYRASGPDAEVAEISFVDLADSADRAILRSASRIRCDDDCFCRNGTAIGDYTEFFVWDQEASRFRRAK